MARKRSFWDLFKPKKKTPKDTTTSPAPEPTSTETESTVTGTIEIYGETHQFTVQQDESLLEALKREEIDVPYSCESGFCSDCKAKLLSGKVKMETSAGLEESEIEEGQILTCQAIPETAEVKVRFDD